MVVDIRALLDLRRDRTSALVTGYKPAKGEIVLLLLRMIVGPKRGLYGFKEVHRD